MSTDTQTSTVEEYISAQPESNDHAYLAWRDEKVRRVLKAKQDGKQDYKSLDEIAARYGRNAR